MHGAFNATTNLECDQTQWNEVRQSCVKGGMVVGSLVGRRAGFSCIRKVAMDCGRKGTFFLWCLMG
jgi:hypothetical protein